MYRGRKRGEGEKEKPHDDHDDDDDHLWDSSLPAIGKRKGKERNVHNLKLSREIYEYS